ncbi:MAG: transglycosylase family protein [Chloroflexi bacterium]|nr:transglycosylase family protein [Chloroflexota bacterium]
MFVYRDGDLPIFTDGAETFVLDGASPAPGPGVSAPSVWDALAACEARGNWAIDTGNGYLGGIQMTESNWVRYGGTAYAPRPDLASRDQQIAIGQKVLAEQGWSAWPACSRRLGLR